MAVITQWMQSSIVSHMNSGVLPVPPPILSRVFQELSNGIVFLSSAQKLMEIPFPFPYAQMVTTMLMISSIGTPMVAGTYVKSPFWASTLTFILVFAFWSINYIAAEIEMPFGEDKNDLNITDLQERMNAELCLLLEARVQHAPDFHPSSDLVENKRMFHSRSFHESSSGFQASG